MINHVFLFFKNDKSWVDNFPECPILEIFYNLSELLKELNNSKKYYYFSIKYSYLFFTYLIEEKSLKTK